MLGMGESSKPLNYGDGEDLPDGSNPWDWVNDVEWVNQLMTSLYGDEQFFFVADDWNLGLKVPEPRHSYNE